MASEWVNNAVEIVTTKSGKKMIKVKKDLTLSKGQNILLTGFEENLAQLVDRGVISEKDAGERMNKVGKFVHYVGSVAPLKSDSDF